MKIKLSMVIVSLVVSGCSKPSTSSEVNGGKSLKVDALDSNADIETRFAWVVNASEADAIAYISNNTDILTARDENDRTLLHLLAKSGDLGKVKHALSAGSDVEATDENLDTPLSFSLRSKVNSELSGLLIGAGADVDHRNQTKRTPLEAFARKGKIEQVSALIELGAHVDAGAPKGEKTPFLLAVEKSELQVAKLLVGKGANIRHTLFDSEDTAIHLASRYSDLEMLQYVLSLGFDVEAENLNGSTPVSEIRFRRSNQAEALKELIGRGADINERAPGGGTLLSYSIKRGRPDFALQLVKMGADFSSPIEQGKTAYELAQGAGMTELVSLMDTMQ